MFVIPNSISVAYIFKGFKHLLMHKNNDVKWRGDTNLESVSIHRKSLGGSTKIQTVGTNNKQKNTSATWVSGTHKAKVSAQKL